MHRRWMQMAFAGWFSATALVSIACTFRTPLEGASCENSGEIRDNHKCIDGVWVRLGSSGVPYADAEARDAVRTPPETTVSDPRETSKTPRTDTGNDTARVDTSETPPDSSTDTSQQRDVCTPDCAARDCGPDGCGGTCGSCHDGRVCETGTCVCPAPTCEHRECGTVRNDCGETITCGSCPHPNSQCVSGTCRCEPSCAGRSCGEPDGCGGACTQPPPGQRCCPGEQVQCTVGNQDATVTCEEDGSLPPKCQNGS